MSAAQRKTKHGSSAPQIRERCLLSKKLEGPPPWFHCLLFFAKRNTVTVPICPAARDQKDLSKDLEEQPQRSQGDKHSGVTSQPACNGPPRAGAWSRGCSGLLLSAWHPISRLKGTPHSLGLAAPLCTIPQASIHATGSSEKIIES